ncbi:MAG: serine hydrolase [Acidobacteriota bacterium]
MMRVARWIFWGVALLMCLIGCSRGGETAELRITAGEPVPEQALESRMRQHAVPGMSIVVIHSGAIDWAKGYGVRKAGEGAAVDRDTLFQAASISKPVTAAGALRLVESGVLQLDQDVNEALRSWKVPENDWTGKSPVTLRRLLSHSAGMTVHGFPGYGEGAALPTLIEILNGEGPANTNPIRVDIEPGRQFRYSGGGYTVVQQLMMDVTGREFPGLMSDLVLEPVGMKHSTFEQPLPEARRSRAAVAHGESGKPLTGSWHTYPEKAAAGLWTTPSDLAKFAIEIRRSYHGLSERLLSQRLARTMLTPELGDYGLGFALPSAGVFRFQHGGGNAGYRCGLVLSVESGDGVVIMTNSDSAEPLMSEVISAIATAYGWRMK